MDTDRAQTAADTASRQTYVSGNAARLAPHDAEQIQAYWLRSLTCRRSDCLHEGWPT